MNVDSMTIGEAKQLAAMLGGATRGKAAPAKGRRFVLIIDRGWIFAGTSTGALSEDGVEVYEDVVHVFRWESIGFARVLTEWKNGKVDLRAIPTPLEVASESVIFRIPVDAGWGKL